MSDWRQAEAQRRLRADFTTGRVYWLIPPRNRKPGDEAGSRRGSSKGKTYWYASFGKKALKRADLVFCLFYGRWPTLILDHIDGDSLNDAITNLREATHQQNLWNMKRKPKNSGLPAGVRRIESNGRYEARITKSGTQIALGCYATPEEASSVYQAKRAELFGEFA